MFQQQNQHAKGWPLVYLANAEFIKKKHVNSKLSNAKLLQAFFSNPTNAEKDAQDVETPCHKNST